MKGLGSNNQLIHSIKDKMYLPFNVIYQMKQLVGLGREVHIFSVAHIPDELRPGVFKEIQKILNRFEIFDYSTAKFKEPIVRLKPVAVFRNKKTGTTHKVYGD